MNAPFAFATLTGSAGQIDWATRLRAEWFERYALAAACAEEALRQFACGGWDALESTEIEDSPAYMDAARLAAAQRIRTGEERITGDGALEQMLRNVRDAGAYAATLSSADIWINRRATWASMADEGAR